MAFGFFQCVALLSSVWSTAKSIGIPDGVLQMECHDRFFLIDVDLSFTGEQPSFEAVDVTGVYPVTVQYAVKCGYTVRVVPQLGRVELRASYFSCHTDNKDDKVFTFNLNLIVPHEGKAVTYALNKTCSPSLFWSPREVTCELNYMEVSVRSEVTCPPGRKKDDWNTLKTAHASTTSDWQVIFQRAEEQSTPMSLSEARQQGYVFDLTDGRLVFRTPYGQPDSICTEVIGVPVEVVHATLFSRQSWVVLMVDLVAACSMHEGSYNDSGYMMWQTPEVLHPLLSGQHETQIHIGVNGELVEQPVAKKRNYTVEKHNSTFQISIPYNAEGGYRKSFVNSDLNDFYVFHLYLEQILVDEDNMKTRFLIHRTLVTPLLQHPVLTENRTVLESETFTAYLGDVPKDVQLAAVYLNGQEFSVPSINTSAANITEIVHADTHSYTLRIPFDDPVVIHQFFKEDAVLQYKLDINYTMTVLPENEPFYHFSSIEATFTGVSPPVFDAVCLESGISFRLGHRPYNYPWELTIGSDPLTPELVARHGYILNNNTESLLLEVPLFTHGYEYKNVTLRGYFGTFEIIVRDRKTLEIQTFTAKTCLFSTTELILCSTNGTMTVVADLSQSIPRGGVPARANLINPFCGPKEADGTWALFSFPINSCGSIVELQKQNVTYKNEISISRNLRTVMNQAASGNVIDGVTVQCTYPLAGLHSLFSMFRFQSDKEGIGSISHSTGPTDGLFGPTTMPTADLQTTPATERKGGLPPRYKPAAHQPALSKLPAA